MAINTPISWTNKDRDYFLAYPRSGLDVRFYLIVLIDCEKFIEQVACVDDFGDLFVIADMVGNLLPHIKPRWPLYVPLGHLEVH